MADRYEQVTEQTDVDGNRVVQTRQVDSTDREGSVNQASRVVWFIVGVINAILLLRFVLALLGANLSNAFANFVYVVSDPFVAPFRGLLQVGEFQAGVSRIEFETLVAVLVYALIGYGLSALIRLASRR